MTSCPATRATRAAHRAWSGSTPSRTGVRQDAGAPGGLCRSLLPVQPRRELVAGRRHRQIRQLPYRPGRRRTRGERRQDRLRLFRRHHAGRAGRCGAGHPCHRAPGREAGGRPYPCRQDAPALPAARSHRHPEGRRKSRAAGKAGTHGARPRSARHAGDGEPVRRIRRGAGGAQRRFAQCRHSSIGTPVAAGDRGGQRPPRTRFRRWWRALRLRLFQRRDIAALRERGSAPGCDQPRCASGSRGQHDRGAGLRLAGHPAA